jgi:DNA-binding CsgD family transcriptional regulator
MRDEGRGAVARLFADLVPDDVITAYEKLHAASGVPKDQAETFLGGAALVRELTDRGMAHPVPHTPAVPASFQAAPPDLALLAILADQQARASHEHDLLLAGYRRLTEAQARPYVGDGSCPEHLVRVITDRDEILRLSLNLINSAHRDWMTLESLHSDMPLTEDYVVAAPPPLREQVRIRSIYDLASTQHPVAASNLQCSMAAGEQARVLPTVPMKMQLADETAVLLPLTPTGTGGALLVRAAPITRALRDYFEMLWERATPVGSTEPPRGCPLSQSQHDVLRLLAQGLQDKAIARRLNISESTVHRHINAITSHLDVTSRFAAGAAAQRRGWLNAPKDGS